MTSSSLSFIPLKTSIYDSCCKAQLDAAQEIDQSDLDALKCVNWLPGGPCMTGKTCRKCHNFNGPVPQTLVVERIKCIKVVIRGRNMVSKPFFDRSS